MLVSLQALFPFEEEIAGFGTNATVPTRFKNHGGNDNEILVNGPVGSRSVGCSDRLCPTGTGGMYRG
jgi:hypothetical protein